MKPYLKKFWKEVALALWLGFVLPASLLGLAVKLEGRLEEKTQTLPSATVQQTTETNTGSDRVEVNVLMDGTPISMELKDYLVGVVLGEMPVDFETEALKAQAVVARTFTLKTQSSGKHDDGAVCTDSACCQAYLAPQTYLEKGGTQDGVNRVNAAVSATAGLVLTYQGELIEATYFSCSGGSTEDAVAVWGTDVPYLRATDSPGEENAAHYTDTVNFTREALSSALGVSLDDEPENWLGAVTYTAGGGVNTMVIGGKEFQGTQLRQLLQLRSTAFAMTAVDGGIAITTKGYGHRVGMSQYGADAMAVGGSGFEEILSHYYQGTALTAWTQCGIS